MFSAWYLSSPSLSSKQVDELTDVQFFITEPPHEAPKETILNQNYAPFQTFADAPILGATPKQVQISLMEQAKNLTHALRAGEVEIHFQNASNEQRVMRCTLKESLVPAHQRVPLAYTLADVIAAPNPAILVTGNKKPDHGLIKAYALDRQGWRSVRIERVTAWHLLGN